MKLQLIEKIKTMREERKQYLFERDHAQFVLESSDDHFCEGVGDKFTVYFDDLFNDAVQTVFYNNDHPDEEHDLVVDSFYCERTFDPVIKKCKYHLYSPWANYVFVYHGPGVRRA